MSKLANVMGGSICSDIVPGRGNVDAIKSQRHEQEQLEKRIKEEAGQVQKRKCTPIEYLLLFGEVPKLEQTQKMTFDDLTVEAAQQLLDAGCSRNHLMQLYGIRNPGGPHYKRLAELFGEKTSKKPEEKTQKKLDITWIIPPIRNLPKIRLNKYNMISINKYALESAPLQSYQSFRARIGLDKSQKILVVQPSEFGEYEFRKRQRTVNTVSRTLKKSIQENGISLPVEFIVTWDGDLQAWIGRLIEEKQEVAKWKYPSIG